MAAPYRAILEAAAGVDVDDSTLIGGDDVLLIDADVEAPPWGPLCDAHDRVVIYPHGAGVPVHWWRQHLTTSTSLDVDVVDVQPPHRHVVGQLVASAGALEVLETFGYPRPLQLVGWPFCPIVRRMAPAGAVDHLRVLVAPQHGWRWEPVRSATAAVIDELVAGVDPADVTVRVVDDFDPAELGIRAGVPIARGEATVADAVAAIDQADVVVAGAGTFAHLAVARGVPLVMYGQEIAGDELDAAGVAYRPVGYPAFVEAQRYPIDHEPGRLLEQIERAWSGRDDEDLVAWRARWIGEPMTPAKLLAALGSFL